MTDQSIYRVAMDEAAHYEHEEDGDDWEVVEAPAPASMPTKVKKKLRSMISVRLAPEELDAIKVAADRERLSVSAFIRAAALSWAHPGAASMTRLTTNNAYKTLRVHISTGRTSSEAEQVGAERNRFDLLTK